MSTTQQPDVLVTVTAGASVEVKKFMDAESVDPARGGLRVSVQPGGCSGFKYGLLIEDEPAEDDIVVDQLRHVHARVRIHFQEPELDWRLRLRQLL
jgi:Fe-S cluster assembly iron-binding protein IscA